LKTKRLKIFLSQFKNSLKNPKISSSVKLFIDTSSSKNLISYVIPFFDQKKYLEEAVMSALGYKYQPKAMIFFSYMSTDSSE